MRAFYQRLSAEIYVFRRTPLDLILSTPPSLVLYIPPYLSLSLSLCGVCKVQSTSTSLPAFCALTHTHTHTRTPPSPFSIPIPPLPTVRLHIRNSALIQFAVFCGIFLSGNTTFISLGFVFVKKNIKTSIKQNKLSLSNGIYKIVI